MSNAKQTIETGKAVLGIEFGSTRIKAVLVNETGEPIASGAHDWENRLEDGIWTYSLDDIWTGLTDCYGRLAEDVKEKYDIVCHGLDDVLKKHGYEREGMHYKAVKPNNDTIVFFCHFGVECVLLSHLINVSPMILWHGFCALPSSITSIYTEERRPGIASFRINEFGSTAHLYAADRKPSFSARFCECYANTNERHD